MPRFDLKTPCKNCPFRRNETRIRFGTRERAEEIEEQAYRYGFPCHLSAVMDQDCTGEDRGYVFGAETQHCAGYLAMQLHGGPASPWPGIDNDEELMDRLAQQMDWDAPVFESVDDFLDANDPDKGGGLE